MLIIVSTRSKSLILSVNNILKNYKSKFNNLIVHKQAITNNAKATPGSHFSRVNFIKFAIKQEWLHLMNT